MKPFLLYLLIYMIPLSSLFAQTDLKLLRQGNKDYRNDNYKEAEINYRKSLEQNSRNYKSLYNLGNALYKQGNYEEAANILNDLSEQKLDDETRSKVYHNLGNAFLKNEKYAESIDAYKKSLRLKSNDLETKYNLSYALSKLQQQQNSSCENNEQNKDNKDKKDEKQQNENENKDKQKEQKEEEQQQPKDELSKDEAERILNALQQQEQNVKDKADKKNQPVRIVIEKDW